MGIQQRYKTLIVAVTLCVGLACIFLAISDSRSSHKDGASEQAPAVVAGERMPATINVDQPASTQASETPKKEAAPLLVNIDQLVADYQENELNADSKYEGKKLEVYGMVVKVTKAADGKPILFLRNFIDLDGVTALLENGQEERAATLRLGDIPHLVCLGGGKVMGRIVIGNCIIKSQPSRPTSNRFGWSTDGLRQDIADALGTPDLISNSPSERKSVPLDAAGQRQAISVLKDCESSSCSWNLLDANSQQVLIADTGALHETRRITHGYYDVLVESKEALTLYQFNGTAYERVECYRRSDGQFGAIAAQLNCVQ